MKRFSWKHLSSKIKLISATIIILMLVQMLILIVVSNNRQTERFNSYASEAFSNSLISMDETLDYLKETTISFSNQQNVFHLFFAENVSRQDLQNFRLTTELIPNKISSLVKNVYIFNAETKEVYSDSLSVTAIDSLPESTTKDIICSGNSSAEKIKLFVDNEIFLIDTDKDSEQMLRICYFPSKRTESCLLMDVSILDLTGIFDTYRNDYSSEIFITNKNTISRGSGVPALQTALQQNITQISNSDFSYPVFRRLNGTEYLVLKKTSKDHIFDVYSLIPSKTIPTNYSETRMLFSINMSLIILACLAVVMFLLLRNFNQAFKENANLKLLRSEEQMSKQFAQKKECLFNCLINPDERDFLAATEYIQSLLQKNGTKDAPDKKSFDVSLLRIEIDNYKSFTEVHTAQDARLYKYGIINICEEILNNHTKAILIHEKSEEIVFLIIDSLNHVDNCRKAIEECRKAVKNYISTDFFAFLSHSGKLSELPKLNKQSIQLAEYTFILNEPCFLTADMVKSEPEVSSQEALTLLDAIFNATTESARDNDFNTFFEALNGMRPEDAKNILWIFMFRLHNVGKRAPQADDSIEDLVKHFNEIQKLSEMYEFFTGFCSSVFQSTVEYKPTNQDHTVLTIQAIIERAFREPDFCCDHIADEMNSSKVYLSRKYKSLTGISISEEILARRMTAFAHELVTTEKSIKTIISDIGGTNYNYYMALFKKRFAMTPTEYRKNHIINPEKTEPN